MALTYRILSLVDITNPEINREETDPIKRGQQANFHTLIQTIGLRSNLTWSRNPRQHDGTLPDPAGPGRGAWWEWEFEVEREAVFDDGQDPVGLLLVDLHGVPVISNLAETVDLQPSIFSTRSPSANIWIRPQMDK